MESSSDSIREERRGSSDNSMQYGSFYGEKVETFQSLTPEIFSPITHDVFPEKKKVLTVERARKGLSILGKIWNLSEYPSSNFINEMISLNNEEKLMDMEGYVDEYQYLHISADNMGLTDISVIPKNFIWLLSADLSGNRLNNTSACPITKLLNIVALRLNRNLIDDPFLPPMKHLQYLGLNSNQIQSLHRIYHPNLETLDVNYNKIKEVDANDCWKLSKLKQLELRHNLLTTTSGIEYSTLVVLYLAQNQITELEGMEVLVNLERLHLRENPLSDLNGFTESNTKLKYLNVRQCKIETVEEFKKLSVLTGLRELIIKGNVFNPDKEDVREEEEGEDDEEYEKSQKDEDEDEDEYQEIRIEILRFLPFLKRINKKLVTKEEIQNMKELLDGGRSY